MTIKGIIETAVYVDDLQATEAFYGTILGLRVMGKEPGRHVFFQAGEANVLLAFLAESTLKGDRLPAHGASGPGHFALGIEADSFDAWQNLLQSHGISIEKEMAWSRGGRSLYFRDPAGNSVELVTPGIWGLPTGGDSMKEPLCITDERRADRILSIVVFGSFLSVALWALTTQMQSVTVTAAVFHYGLITTVSLLLAIVLWRNLLFRMYAIDEAAVMETTSFGKMLE